MSVYYQGSDGHIKSLGDNELQHFKYIKKIGNRYFYTPEELRAYYAEAKNASNREAAFNQRTAQNERRFRDDVMKDAYSNQRKAMKNGMYVIAEEDSKGNLRARDATKAERKKGIKDLDRRERREKRVNKLIDRLSDTKRNAKKKVDPLAKTAKMAAKGKEAPKTTKSKYSREEVDTIRRKSWAQNVQRKDALKKKKKKEAAHKQYSPAARW